jgi:outer membrane receptor protein involved in Fe transport
VAPHRGLLHRGGAALGAAAEPPGPRRPRRPAHPDRGTPGFGVVDLRAGYRWQPHLLVAAVLENVGNAAYRYHGSSVNGPGRGFNLLVEFGF